MPQSKRSNFMADFETTTLEDDCRVWGWGLTEIESCESLDDVEIGTDIKSFLERINKVSPAVVYFQNLKFDGRFIVDYLLREGFTSHEDAGSALGRGEFKTLISGMGEWYTITVKWWNGRRTEFRDSMKKLPMSVKRVAESFNLPVEKGEIDYHTPRPVGHVITEDEAYYIRLDVFIVAMALKLQFEQGMVKLTVGSDSLAEYKNITGERMWPKLFPILPEDMDSEIRMAYRGGFTYADPRFTKELTGKGIVYDVNSLYPSVMYDRVLPYGEPIYHETIPEPTKHYPLFIASITFTAKLKPNHIPCIQIKGMARFAPTEYLEEITEPTTLMVTNVDLALWQDHYDLEILAYNGSWKFKGVSGLFTDFIDKWMEVKANSKGGMREIAKLHLNSLYGKFATNPKVTGKYPILEDDVVRLKTAEEETREPVYTAMGVFITSYARDVTIRAAQEHYDVFAYADTDSLHLLVEDDPQTLEIHPSALGAWKREYAFTAARYIRAKQYMEHVGPEHCTKDHDHVPGCEYETHIAGLSRSVAASLTFADLTEGKSTFAKKVPRAVPGGVVLKEVGFTLTI